jgi:uncharacterized membrane-anchored protein
MIPVDVAKHNKVPDVTIAFWLIKLVSTTVGETGADYLAVHVGLGTASTGAIVGTQITDSLIDEMEASLYLNTLVFAVLLTTIFVLWYLVERTLSIHTIVTVRRELFYWTAILFTFALGTAVGDFTTQALGLSSNLKVLAVGATIAGIAGAYYLGADAFLTFWLAYILTWPLGASLGDLLSQPRQNGGAGLGTSATSVTLLIVISIFVLCLSLGRSWPPIRIRQVEDD